MNVIWLYCITSLCYAALGVHFWRQVNPDPHMGRLTHRLVAVPLLTHGWLLAQTAFTSAGLNLGVGLTLSLIVWLTVLIYWLGNFQRELDGLQAIIFPGASLVVISPLLLPATHIVAHAESQVLLAHLLIALLAYSLFAIATWHALLMYVFERNLHRGQLPRVLQQLPPLMTMEQILFRVLWTGFFLLTLTLASGILFSETLFGQPLSFSHKTVFALLSWVVFATLLGGRLLYGWRGRLAIRLTLLGSLLLVLAYIGTRFVLDVVLGSPG